MSSVYSRFDATKLTGEKARELREFFSLALQERDAPWPAGIDVVIYVNGAPKFVKGGRWRTVGNEIHIGLSGGAEENIGNSAKVSILGALLRVVGWHRDPELLGLWVNRLARLMNNLYKDNMETITESDVPVRRIAFTTSAVMGLMEIDGEEKWFLPNGEETRLPADAMVVEVA